MLGYCSGDPNCEKEYCISTEVRHDNFECLARGTETVVITSRSFLYKKSKQKARNHAGWECGYIIMLLSNLLHLHSVILRFKDCRFDSAVGQDNEQRFMEFLIPVMSCHRYRWAQDGPC